MDARQRDGAFKVRNLFPHTAPPEATLLRFLPFSQALISLSEEDPRGSRWDEFWSPVICQDEIFIKEINN